uniref:non-specific serine/threonine protein kinase n=1 Tax=Oryza rufipogon TaxID=4529 RepID=A0A0E0NA10_ORYRU
MQPPHFSYKTQSNRLPIPVLSLALVLLLNFTSPTSSCTEQEKNSLLNFLTGLSKDGGLSMSWKDGVDCCEWEGITCRTDRTVTDVSLPSRSLEGYISPSLGNLTGLLRLNLSYNLLSSVLPQELLSSSKLIVIDISFNRLNGGLDKLPSSTPARPLQVLNISSNLLAGQFPSSTWVVMTNLAALNVSNNSFTGKIPTNFCTNSPSLAVLELSYNQFSGSIPPELGSCSRLRVLKAGHNNLSGTLPDEIFNATSLECLSFPNNNLQGTLEGANVVKLGKLATLDLGENNFSGNIPESIGQLNRLEELHLNNNKMFGSIPSTLSNCTSLKTIDLNSNNFSGELMNVNFSNLPSLQTLDLRQNIFSGKIPETIYSCSNLTALRLSLNKFQGQLSKGLGNLKSLSFLSLGYNNLTNITNALQILRSSSKLTTLLISNNFMNESIPDDDRIDGFENLQVLDLSGCSFSGKIPQWLSKLSRLEMLVLDNNQLTGPIPDWISSLNFLFYLDVSNNNLTGEIPMALLQMPMLRSDRAAAQLDTRAFELPIYIDATLLQYRKASAFPKVLNLGNNEFTGLIPQEIGQLKALLLLNLSFNKLYGDIPQSICNLRDLLMLDLSSNNLTGTIPAALNNLTFLIEFNVSYNDLEGPIPTGGQFSTFTNSSFYGNPKLCGPMLTHHCSSFDRHLVSKQQQNKKVILVIVFCVLFGAIVILLLLGYLLLSIRGMSFTTKSRCNNDYIEALSPNTNSDHLLVMLQQGKEAENKLTFTGIVEATNNFNQEHIIGCGGYGLVYKAQLPDGSMIAIKKLNGEMCLMEREFSAEVETLSMARHDNLVPLWGYCIQGNSRLLIYSYMENGSLDDWLHNKDDDTSTILDWPRRLKIAKGASHGLSYIHNICKPRIVHRDIKSSNILLDKEFKAYIADFGLSRLILPNKTHVTTELVGTLGYIPPEYAQAWVATLKGDVYSFGVVLLELLTGRRPVPILSTSKELVPWVQEMVSNGKQIEVLDLTFQGTGCEEQMLKVLEIACKCVKGDPLRRPTMIEVVASLHSIDPDGLT